MESLYLLLPLSVLLVFALIALFAWALHSGQFDDLEREGWRVLEDEDDRSGAAQRSVVAEPRPDPLDYAQESGDHPDHNVVLKDKTRSEP